MERSLTISRREIGSNELALIKGLVKKSGDFGLDWSWLKNVGKAIKTKEKKKETSDSGKLTELKKPPKASSPREPFSDERHIGNVGYGVYPYGYDYAEG